MQAEEVRLQRKIRDLLARAEAEDQADDTRRGANRRGDELTDEQHRRESRMKMIREARAALEAEARAKATTENAAKNAVREAGGKEPKLVDPDRVRPEAKAQRNFTDPGSRIMSASNKGWGRRGRMKRHGLHLPSASDHE